MGRLRRGRGGVIIRPETEADRSAVYEVVAAAFGQRDEADLVERLRASDAFVPELSLVAEDGSGEVVGHVLFSWVGLGPCRVLSLAPLAVAPARQRQGIGDALTRAGLAVIEAMGESLVVVLGHPEYYPRFGFQPARPLGIDPGIPPHREDAWMAKLFPADDGTCRGTVRYPAAFDTAR